MDTKNWHQENFQNLLATLEKQDKAKLVVGFFINNASISQDEWMDSLAAALKKMGFFTIGLMTRESQGKCRLLSVDKVALVEPDQLTLLERVNAFVISDIDMEFSFPKTSKVFGCIHAFETMRDTSFHNQMFHISAVDAMLIPFPISEKTRKLTTGLWTGFASRDACKRKGEDFSFIPAGYPRMILLANELAKSEQARDSILYAPMTTQWGQEQGGEKIKKHGKSIIRTILKSFPDKKVIFRPFKDDLDTPIVREICESFAEEPKFDLDSNPGRLPSFSRAAILITDLSHIAKTFAYSTLRPSIYYQPWNKKIKDVRTAETGFIVSTMKSLVDCIKSCLDNPDESIQTMRKLRDLKIAPIDNGFVNIGNAINNFCKGHNQPEWLTVKRFEKQISDSELIKRMLALPQGPTPIVAAIAAKLHLPASPLLLAYALHIGLISMPQTETIHEVGRLVAEYMGISEIPKKYSDVDPHLIRTLYSLSLRNAIRNKDIQGIAIAEYLLNEFNSAFPDDKK